MLYSVQMQARLPEHHLMRTRTVLSDGLQKGSFFSAWSPIPHPGPYSSLERFPTQTPDTSTHNQPNPQSPNHGRSFSLTGSSGRCCLVATFSRLVECDRSVPSPPPPSPFYLLTSSPWSLLLLVCAIQSPTARLCLSGSTWQPSHWVWLSPGPFGVGVQGWRSGESTRLPPMWPGFDSRTRRHMWVEFVGSLLCTERFSPGTPVSPLLKNQHLTWFTFIVNFSLQCPQLALQR